LLSTHLAALAQYQWDYSGYHAEQNPLVNISEMNSIFTEETSYTRFFFAEKSEKHICESETNNLKEVLPFYTAGS
jgi:hypothetical protein